METSIRELIDKNENKLDSDLQIIQLRMAVQMLQKDYEKLYDYTSTLLDRILYLERQLEDDWK